MTSIKLISGADFATSSSSIVTVAFGVELGATFDVVFDVELVFLVEGLSLSKDLSRSLDEEEPPPPPDEPPLTAGGFTALPCVPPVAGGFTVLPSAPPVAGGFT